MRFGPYLRTRLCALAMLATALVAAMPTVSLLLAARDGAGWVLVCSHEGARLLNPDGSDSQGPGNHVFSDAPCGYCVLAHHAPVLPKADGAAQLAPRSHAAVHVARLPRYVAPVAPAPVEAAHRPRGPPSATV